MRFARKGVYCNMSVQYRVISIEKRALSEQEIALLVEEVKQFKDLAYVKPHLWRSFTDVTVAMVDGEFAGCCATELRFGWRKIGPIAVRRVFHNLHVGAQLLRSVLEERKQEQFYFGTSHKKLKEFVKQFPHIKKVPRLRLPFFVLLSTLFYIIEYMSLQYLIEGVRKRIQFGRDIYEFYICSADKT